MSAKTDAFLSALDNHVRRVINSKELVPENLTQRGELRTLMDAYIDERIEQKLKERGLVEKR